jgi:nitrate reductase gamma subunit
MEREILGTALAAAAYIVIALFSYRVIWRIVIMSRGRRGPRPGTGTTLVAVLKTMADVLFLWRLFRVNRWLWAGEWAFHVSLPLVLIGHLRFFLYPVPQWLVETRQLLGYAGYVFVSSLVYIFVFKLLVERSRPLPLYNLFLLTVALLTGLTGMLMGKVFKPDLLEVKGFVLGALALRPEGAPGGALFTAHFLLVLIFVLYLPAHLFAAPVVMLEARRREEGLGTVMREK